GQRHKILHLQTLQPVCLNTAFLLCAEKEAMAVDAMFIRNSQQYIVFYLSWVNVNIRLEC
ncbi:MAG: hypothetical protein K2K81_01630, partial [Muribaculaceae bacterium]|nr:hypothetical protein [Muribaculaceae bacterium]